MELLQVPEGVDEVVCDGIREPVREVHSCSLESTLLGAILPMIPTNDWPRGVQERCGRVGGWC